MLSRSIIAFCLTAAASLWLVTSVAAQTPKFVELSSGQQMLINEGAKASNAGDYAKAVRLLQVSLDLGKVNVTYLNLGRALQRNGQCEEARHAFDKALLAPPVQNPSPAEVKKIIARFGLDLKAICHGNLIVTCDQNTTAYSLNAGKKWRCDGTPLSLKPGKYTVKAFAADRASSREVTVHAFQKTFLQMTVQQPILKNVRDQFKTAISLVKSDQLSSARIALINVHKSAPHWGPPMFELGQIALRQKHYVEAIKWFERHRPYAQPSDIPKLDRLVGLAERGIEALLNTKPPAAKKPGRNRAASN